MSLGKFFCYWSQNAKHYLCNVRWCVLSQAILGEYCSQTIITIITNNYYSHPKLHPKPVNIQICGAGTSKISIIMKNLQLVV